MNEKINAFLKDLPPELQEKAKDIKTQEELMEFLSDNDVEIPEDALENVSGGCTVPNEYNPGAVLDEPCPDCGARLVYHDNCKVTGEGNCLRAHCPTTGVLYYKRSYKSYLDGPSTWHKYVQ